MCSTVVELLALVHMVPGSNPLWGHYNYTEKYTLKGIDDINEIYKIKKFWSTSMCSAVAEVLACVRMFRRSTPL